MNPIQFIQETEADGQALTVTFENGVEATLRYAKKEIRQYDNPIDGMDRMVSGELTGAVDRDDGYTYEMFGFEFDQTVPKGPIPGVIGYYYDEDDDEYYNEYYETICGIEQ